MSSPSKESREAKRSSSPFQECERAAVCLESGVCLANLPFFTVYPSFHSRLDREPPPLSHINYFLNRAQPIRRPPSGSEGDARALLLAPSVTRCNCHQAESCAEEGWSGNLGKEAQATSHHQLRGAIAGLYILAGEQLASPPLLPTHWWRTAVVELAEGEVASAAAQHSSRERICWKHSPPNCHSMVLNPSPED